MNSYKVFHTDCEFLKERIDIVLVRPESPGNIGSAARALANMGIRGQFSVVGSALSINDDARKFACHAQEKLENIRFVDSLSQAIYEGEERRQKNLVLAATARVGSAHRPHPIRVQEAVQRAVEQLRSETWERVTYVFGSESDGLENFEVAMCDWVVTIPSSNQYRSLNLAQAVLIFAYETQRALLTPWESFESSKPSQKDRLVKNILQVAEEVGFILPGDPFKMAPKLESMMAAFPRHIPEVATWHGLIDQVRRSIQRGMPDVRGRYRRMIESSHGKREEKQID